MIAKIAVSAATFAIDKPYSYCVPDEMELQPGQRVTVPFGRGNRRCEGVVLSVENASFDGLKAVERCLDEQPVVSPVLLRLAAFVRERYFCTFYEAIRAMLPVIIAQLVVILKDTALGFIITYPELLDYAKFIGTQAQFDSPLIPAAMVVGAIYVGMCLTVAGLAKIAEERVGGVQAGWGA